MTRDYVYDQGYADERRRIAGTRSFGQHKVRVFVIGANISGNNAFT